MTTISGSKDATRLATPTPSHEPTSAKAASATGSPGLGRRGDRRPGQVLDALVTDEPGEGVAAAVLLPAAGAAALARPPAGHDLVVAELPRHPVVAAQHRAVEDQRAADAGAEGDHDGALGVAHGAVGQLGAGGAVGVVVEHHRGAPPLRQAGAHALVLPGQVRREPDPLPLRVDEPGRRDADRADASYAGDLLDRLGQRVLDEAGVDPAPRRRAGGGADHPAGRRDGRREDLGPADVDTDEEGHPAIRSDGRGPADVRRPGGRVLHRRRRTDLEAEPAATRACCSCRCSSTGSAR